MYDSNDECTYSSWYNRVSNSLSLVWSRRTEISFTNGVSFEASQTRPNPLHPECVTNAELSAMVVVGE